MRSFQSRPDQPIEFIQKNLTDTSFSLTIYHLWDNPFSKYQKVPIEFGLSVLNRSNKEMKLRKYVHKFRILFSFRFTFIKKKEVWVDSFIFKYFTCIFIHYINHNGWIRQYGTLSR